MKQILVVEDQESIRTLVERVLTRSGYAVVTAASGQEGWMAFQKQSFALVSTDWMMPNGGGEWLVEQVMASGVKVPVIILTSQHEADCLKPEWKEKNVHHMQKPFVAPAYIQLVSQIILPS